MKKFFVFCFLLFSLKLLGNSPDNSYLLAITTGEPSALVGNCVNAITGDYVIFQDSISVQGAQPLKLTRRHISRFSNNGLAGNFFFENNQVVTQLAIDGFFLIPHPSGANLIYSLPTETLKKIFKKEINTTKSLSLVEGAFLDGLTNASGSEISGRLNLKNNTVDVVFVEGRIKKILVKGADGSQREFERIEKKRKILNPFTNASFNYYRISKETLSNKNNIFYKYDKNGYPKEIRSTNPDGSKVYAQINIMHSKKAQDQNYYIKTSDNKNLNYTIWTKGKNIKKTTLNPSKKLLEKIRKKGSTYFLNEISSSDHPFEKNTYLITDQTNDLKKYPLIQRILPDDRITCIDYNISLKPDDVLFQTVSQIKQPIGDSKSSQIAYNFFYYPAEVGNKGGSTHVIDALGNKTIYKFSKHLRLEEIEHFEGANKFIKKEKFVWGDNTTSDLSFLVCKSYYDSNDNAFFSRRFFYDRLGNPIKEILYGNLSGQTSIPIEFDTKNLPIDKNIESFTKKRTYSKDKNLLIKEEDDTGLAINFTYHLNTDLIASKIITHKDRVKIRQFYDYDNDNILIKETLDDGSTFDKNNLDGVTERKIKIIKLVNSGSFINMPEIIEERFLDFSSNREKLIQKTKLIYSEFGKIIKEEIFDENDIFRYEINREFDTSGNLIKEINPLDHITTYKYDDNFNKIEETLFSNKVKSTFDYDYSNRLTKIHETTNEGLSHTTKHKYDLKSNRVQTDDYLANQSSYKYDAMSNLIQERKSAVLDQNQEKVYPILDYEYDAASRKTKETDGRNISITTEYNAYNKPTKITYSDGSYEIYVYNLDGALKYHIDQIGTKTQYEYDFLQRNTQITKMSQTGELLYEEEKCYTAFHLISHKDAEGNITSYSYDNAGRLISEKINNEEIQYEYDSLSRLHTTKIINGNNTLNIIQEKDFLDRVIEERKEDNLKNILTLEKYEYDEAGNKICITKYVNGKEPQDKFSFDGFNRLTKHIDPLLHETKIIYDENHISELNQKVLKKTTTDPVGLQRVEISNALDSLSILEKRNKENLLLSQEHLYYDLSNNLSTQISTIFSPNSSTKTIKTSWNYNSMNRVKSLIEAKDTPDEKTTRYKYTPKGQLFKTTKPDNTILENDYDALGNHKSLISSNGSIHYTFEYNKLSQLINSKDHITSLSIERTLDHKGRVLKEKLANGFELQNLYDLSGKKVKQILPDNSSVEYTYDALFLKEINRKDSSGNIKYTHYFLKYDLSGNLIKETSINNNHSIDYTFDLLNRKSSIKAPNFSQTIDQFDPDGKIRQMTFSHGFENDVSTFFYDDLKQLIEEKGLFNKKYLFDSNKNRVQKDGVPYQLNDLNQIIESSISKYTYDKNGNPITQHLAFADLEFCYDDLDRLISVIYPKNFKLEFTYDSEHRRVSKTLYNYINLLVSEDWVDQYTEHYIFDNQNEIGAYKNNKLSQLRVLKDSNQAEIGSAIAIEINNVVYFPIHDIQGNVAAITPIDLEYPTEYYRYSAFGEEKILDHNKSEIPKSNLKNPWRFSSKRKDQETNLIYFGRRYYDPEVGRWLTPDPKGFTDGLNLYVFVDNDPLIYVDLYGLINEKTKYYNLEKPEISPYQRIYFSNGVWNTYEEAKSSAQYLSRMIKNSNIHVIYNEHINNAMDVVRAGLSLTLPRQTKASKLMASEWMKFLDQDEKNEILHICHSEATINTRNALLNIPREYRRRINIVGIAPAAYMAKNLAKNIYHYAAEGDFITKIDKEGKKSCSESVITLSADKYLDKDVHAFQHLIYKDKLQDHLNKFTK